MPSPAYKLVEICAAGTFGTVCVARDQHTGELVALKVLKQAHLHRPRVIARTRDEASMMSKLDHPNIADVQGLIEIDDRPMVVMEWVRGVSLEEVLVQRPDGLPLGVSIEIVRLAAAALGAAYTTVPRGGSTPMGIIHRDIKPSNMLLSVDGDLKIVDFGIAHGTFEGKEAKTMSMVLGARGYLAPERLDGHDDKPTCDIYSLGICLYEFLTGKHIVLSVHHTFHAEALEKNLARLSPPGMSEEALADLRDIVGAMCHYHESRRPDHETVVERLGHLLTTHDIDADIAAYARDEVVALFSNRPRITPREHPGYTDLAFLDRSARDVIAAPPDVDEEVRRILREPTWLERRAEVEHLLLKNPHWTAAPFLELLPDGVKPWWRFWSAEPDPRQIVAALQILQKRMDAEVRQRVLLLRRHAEPTIAEAATALLGSVNH